MIYCLTRSVNWIKLNAVQLIWKDAFNMARRTGLTRDEIQAQALAVGSDLIGKYGLAKFSMRQVAKEIGYTGGTLYNVFKNQDDFLLQINAITLNELQCFIQSGLKPNSAGKDILLNIANSYYVFAKEHYALWRTLFEYTLAEETTLPQWYTDKIASLMGVAEQALSGMNLSSTQIKYTSRALWASVHGICALSLADKLALTKSEPAEDLIYELIDKYFAGLALEEK